MPEGDSIFRAARDLHQALAGRTVSRFASVYPHLTNPLEDRPLVGERIDRVEARGKHLLIGFSGGRVLRTHMRMHGSWHIYRPGERWQRPRHEMRILLETPEVHAVAFNVPVAEFLASDALDRAEPLSALGPDVLRDDFDPSLAVMRLQERADLEIADALLDQTAVAGIGNIYKSETLFVARINPFVQVTRLTRDEISRAVATASQLMRAGRFGPRAHFWVYDRAGQPCRRCGTPIERAKQGPFARSTYWCPSCQGVTAAFRLAPDRG